MLRVAFVGFKGEIALYVSAIARSVSGIEVVPSEDADVLVVNNSLDKHFPGREVITFIGVKGQALLDFAEIGHDDSWAPIFSLTGSELRCRLEGLVRRLESISEN